MIAVWISSMLFFTAVAARRLAVTDGTHLDNGLGGALPPGSPGSPDSGRMRAEVNRSWTACS
jgi:hypothetical protein